MKGYVTSNGYMRTTLGSDPTLSPEGVDAELLAKVLANPEMAALLTSLAKTMK